MGKGVTLPQSPSGPRKPNAMHLVSTKRTLRSGTSVNPCGRALARPIVDPVNIGPPGIDLKREVLPLALWLLWARRRPRPTALCQEHFYILDFTDSRAENFCLCGPCRRKA